MHGIRIDVNHLRRLSIDLWLRKQNPTGHGLDGVLRDLWTRGCGPVGYAAEDFEAVLAEHARCPLPDRIRALWSEAAELTYDDLDTVGIELVREDPPSGAVDLGFRTRTSEGGLWVTDVDASSPAERAGLSPGDELVAIRGPSGRSGRIRAQDPKRAWAQGRAGEHATVMVARRDRLHELTLSFRPAQGALKLRLIDDAPAEVRRAFELWLEQGMPDQDEACSSDSDR